jgi:hypothetical protein
MLMGVNYTLHKEKDYKRLHDLLRSTGTYCHALDSFWIVKTDESLSTWFQRIRAVMDNDDDLMIHDMTEAFVNRKVLGYLPEVAVEWIDSYVGVPAYVH